MRKRMLKLIMYYDAHQLNREGLRPSQIARQLGLDYRTVKKYLSMSIDEYEGFLEKHNSRDKLLEPYENFVKTRLEACPDASAAQVHDWLKEHFDDFIEVNAKTVFNFVLHIRNIHGVPKPFDHRDYEKVDELPYGQQSQVDFGEYNMFTQEGKRKKVYFHSMVLSRSRQKHLLFTERPFTTLVSTLAHEQSFQHFEGITDQVVYDQDTLFLVNENKGDLILTEAFRKYAEYRGFKLHFCRKSDPQSKGKIENVVRYIKHNFLRGRVFVDIHTLNQQALAWLERTANAKVHAATRKVPHDEWLIEKNHLNPFLGHFETQRAFNDYGVRKDNTVHYKGNFYRVPTGTYKGPKTTVWTEATNDHKLIIYNTDNKQIASHMIYPGEGKTIGGSNYKRDFSSSIDQMIDDLSLSFQDPDMTKEYLLRIRQDKPRYIRDQLQHIKKLTDTYAMEIMSEAMAFCIENNIYKATDLGSVAKKFNARKSQQSTIAAPIKINTLNQGVHKIIPNRSDISDYQQLMK